MKTPPRGGKRKGAGRKPTLTAAQQQQIASDYSCWADKGLLPSKNRSVLLLKRQKTRKLSGKTSASQVIMREIDQMPPKWRALVYEYGFQIVMHAYSAGYDYETAVEELAEWRVARQEQLLA